MIGPAGTCRAAECRATFQWAETVNGHRIPIDPEPAAPGGGNVRLERRERKTPLAVVLTGSDLTAAQGRLEELYLAHHGTCIGNKGGQFRRGRK